MKITVNGKEQALDKNSLSLAELLIISNVENPEVVSVQRNGEFIDKQAYKDTFVQEGDKVDFLYFMGGGSNSEA